MPMGIPIPMWTPTPAWAEDNDNVTMVRTAPTIKTVLAFLATPPAQIVILTACFLLRFAEE
jgi:hypothetical protein